MHRRTLLLAVFAMLPTLSARADVPPEPGYVESCTVANQTRPGRECRECGTYFGNPPDFCAQSTGAGFSQRCRTRGASTWTEVWCKDTGGAAPATGTATTGTATAATTGSASTTGSATTGTSEQPTPAAAEEDDCSTAPVGSLALPACVLAALFVASRRRVIAKRR